MSENTLFPTFDVPDFIEEDDTEAEKYKKSIYWDLNVGDFVRDGANRILQSSGKDAYMQWCYKIACTERYAYLAYPDTIGVEMIDAMDQLTHDAVESCIERTISEALLENPLTEYVNDFSFEWQGDGVICEYAIKGRDWEEFHINTNINFTEVDENDT